MNNVEITHLMDAALLRRIRSQPWRRRIKLTFVTRIGGKQRRARGRQLRNLRRMTKP